MIELLVVIAIIAILAAILFPVFAQAKRSAKSTSDLSNARNVATSVHLYMSDSDDVMPIFYAYNSDSSIYNPAQHKGTEVILMPYLKSKEAFLSKFDAGSPYLAIDPGLVASASKATTYWTAYGSSFRFSHCTFSTVKDESSQNNAFAIYDYVSGATNVTRLVSHTSFAEPAQTRMIRLEMMPWFSAKLDPGCAKYGYDCGPGAEYYREWNSGGGPVLYTDGHAKHQSNSGQFDNDRVNVEGNRSGEVTANPNAWSGTWYSLCD